MKKVLLIDGFGLIFKAYYAFINRPLTNRNGENTSAVFGFFKSLISLLKKEKPDYYIVALEGRGKCFRNEIYPEYKANRPPAPEDLVHQIPRIIGLLDKLGIPHVFKDGYEADDIIGTAAEKFSRKKDFKVLILTSDKDLRQLVTDNILIYNPGKSLDEYDLYDKENVFKKMNVRPDQVVDYLALAGDASDNIPGISGVGAKTACDLLKEFDNLDNIYANADKIKKKSVKEKIISQKDNAYLSKKLAEIKKDVDIALDEEQWKSVPLDLERSESDLLKDNLKNIIESVKDYNASVFNKSNAREGLFDGIDSGFQSKDENAGQDHYSLSKEYELIKDIKILESKAEIIKNEKAFCFDLETTGFDFLNDEIICMSIAVKDHVFVIPFDLSNEQQEEAGVKTDKARCDKILNILKPVFENPEILKIGHNIKFDMKFLRTAGIDASGPVFDTMIAEYCLDASFNILNMDDMALKYLSYKTIHYEDVVKDIKNKTLKDVAVNELVKYSGEDADITYQLYFALKDRLKANESIDRLFYEIEMPLVFALADMEYIGVNINSSYLNDLSSRFDEALKELNEKIIEIAETDFNPNSPKQTADILYNKFKLPVIKKTKTGPSTDVHVLEKLSYIHPIASLLLEHRTVSKLKSTYSDSLPEMINKKSGRIHTNYMQTGTQTGRLSSKNPNLQNIPVKTDLGRKIRKAFVPTDGNMLISADYSQIELFLLAEFSKDPNLIGAFKSGEDIHLKTASLIFDKQPFEVTKEERTIGKTINFSVLYGQGPHRLSESLKITRGEASNFINLYFAKYSGVSNYMHEIKEQTKKTGYALTYWGRKRTIPEIRDRNKMVMANGERMAVNTTIQGTAADLIKVSMVRIHEKFKKDKIRSKLIMQVHDELIFDVYKDEKDKVIGIIKESMEDDFDFKLKLKTSIQTGGNWGEIQ